MMPAPFGYQPMQLPQAGWVGSNGWEFLFFLGKGWWNFDLSWVEVEVSSYLL